MTNSILHYIPEVEQLQLIDEDGDETVCFFINIKRTLLKQLKSDYKQHIWYEENDNGEEVERDEDVIYYVIPQIYFLYLLHTKEIVVGHWDRAALSQHLSCKKTLTNQNIL